VVFTPLFLVLLALGAVPLALAGAYPPLISLALLYNGALLVALLLDVALMVRLAPDDCRREVAQELSLGIPNVITLRLVNRAPRAARLLLKDEPPSGFDAQGHLARLDLPPRTEVVHRYHVTPRRRGDYEFAALNLRFLGPFGLIALQRRLPQPRPVRVYPNLIQVREFDLLARRGRLVQAGLRLSRWRGRGTEFESLRDYLPDDDFRRINWKASARRARLTSQEYEAERSQNVLLVLDLGRLMTTEHQGMSKVDYAVNAALMLGYVCASVGDRVGLLLFSSEIEGYLPPGRGKAQVFRLLRELYRAEPKMVEPNYAAAFHYLNLHSRRRTLVVVFTDIVDPMVSQDVVEQLRALFPAHLPLCVTMKDASLAALSVQEPTDAPRAYERAIAIKTLRERDEALAALRNGGVLVLDTRPEDLTVDLVNRYLEVKARALL
jgi:uncharacterized protein (DUF58 family)